MLQQRTAIGMANTRGTMATMTPLTNKAGPFDDLGVQHVHHHRCYGCKMHSGFECPFVCFMKLASKACLTTITTYDVL
jgi:hypothetical protein